MNIKELKNLYKGKMGFVIGSGPSLHFQDLSLLNNYVTIVVNSGILKIKKPDFFLSDDLGARSWNYYNTDAAVSNCKKLLFYDKLRKHCGHFNKDDVVLFKHKWWYDPKTHKKNLDGLVMTRDPNSPIVGARTSAGSAVHFAYIMGCDPIVLLGCDCCYNGNKRYFWQFPGEKKAYRITGEKVYCFANKGKKDGKPVDSHCVSFTEYWAEFSNKNKDIANIIYASEGGILNCFPKMSLPEVLDKFGERKK